MPNPLVLPLILAALAAPAPPDDQGVKKTGVPAVLQRRVDASIESGVRLLSLRQARDGAWRFRRKPVPLFDSGLTALVGIALIHGGVPRTDPRIVRARTFVTRRFTDGIRLETRRIPDRNIYNWGLSLTFLLEAGVDPQDPIPRRLTRHLAVASDDLGYWGYNPFRNDRPPPPGSVPNISTTLYAVLGLRTAHRYGLPVDRRSVGLLFESLREHQKHGGWGYAPADNLPMDLTAPYFSGTTNGLAAYLMAGEILGRWDSPKAAREDSVVRRAVAWIGRNFTPHRGPVSDFASEPLFREPHYGLYAAERAGCLLDLREFREVDWYVRGVRFLVASQRKDGAWHPPRGVVKKYSWFYDSTVTTAFGVLFLCRRTPAVTTPPNRVAGARTAREFDGLDLRGGPTLASGAFADLAAAALSAFEWLSSEDRKSRRGRFALLGPRVIGPLVHGLDAKSPARRRAAIEILRDLTGEDFDYAPDASPEARRPAVRMWEHWRKTVAPRLVLSKDRLVVTD